MIADAPEHGPFVEREDQRRENEGKRYGQHDDEHHFG